MTRHSTMRTARTAPAGAAVLLTLLSALAILAGCARPPDPPLTEAGEPVRKLHVTGDAERAQVAEVLKAKTNYRYRLQVLQEYYERTGRLYKLRWAKRELENLEEAQTFTFIGAPRFTAPAGENIDDADERLLVELAVAAREGYKDAVAALQRFYAADDQALKAQLIRNMQDRLDPVRTYDYFLAAEIPPADLEPTSVIPQAEERYAEALRLHKQGKLLPVVTDYRKQRLALQKFRKLIRDYPQSTKIAMAAYYIGDIYKEYFHENVRAVHWYERAWQWDPTIPKPARFQAATVYDFRLHNRARAVALYRAAITHEPFNRSNVEYAAQRIAELTEK